MQVRELTLILLGCVVGYLFVGWSLSMLVQRWRMSPAERTLTRVGPWLIGIFLFIGLADSFKATKDLIVWFSK